MAGVAYMAPEPLLELAAMLRSRFPGFVYPFFPITANPATGRLELMKAHPNLYADLSCRNPVYRRLPVAQ